MAEAPEHAFLSKKFLEVIETFSKSGAYGYTEASRKKFDFACNIQQDWSRPLVGQTLWKHQEGVDKDIRSMILEPDTDIWAYIVRDNVKNRALLQEVLQDFRKSVQGNQLFKLKVFWVPQDFDADDESARTVVGSTLQDAVINDLLFNVVFGRLSATDIKYFLSAPGSLGLNLAVLYEIATNGFFNYTVLSERIRASVGPVREKIFNLLGCGFIWSYRGASMYYVSLKGRVFLKLLQKYILEEKEQGVISEEVKYLFKLLDVDLRPNNVITEIHHKGPTIIKTYHLANLPTLHAIHKYIMNPDLTWEESHEEILEPSELLENYLNLLRQVRYAEECWGVDLAAPMQFKIHEDENHPYRSLAR